MQLEFRPLFVAASAAAAAAVSSSTLLYGSHVAMASLSAILRCTMYPTHVSTSDRFVVLTVVAVLAVALFGHGLDAAVFILLVPLHVIFSPEPLLRKCFMSAPGFTEYLRQRHIARGFDRINNFLSLDRWSFPFRPQHIHAVLCVVVAWLARAWYGPEAIAWSFPWLLLCVVLAEIVHWTREFALPENNGTTHVMQAVEAIFTVAVTTLLAKCYGANDFASPGQVAGLTAVALICSNIALQLTFGDPMRV